MTEILMQRLVDKRSWRRVVKALIVLHYCLQSGSGRFSAWCRLNTNLIRDVEFFQYPFEGGEDCGIVVRKEVQKIIALLEDSQFAEMRKHTEAQRVIRGKILSRERTKSSGPRRRWVFGWQSGVRSKASTPRTQDRDNLSDDSIRPVTIRQKAHCAVRGDKDLDATMDEITEIARGTTYPDDITEVMEAIIEALAPYNPKETPGHVLRAILLLRHCLANMSDPFFNSISGDPNVAELLQSFGGLGATELLGVTAEAVRTIVLAAQRQSVPSESLILWSKFTLAAVPLDTPSLANLQHISSFSSAQSMPLVNVDAETELSKDHCILFKEKRPQPSESSQSPNRASASHHASLPGALTSYSPRFQSSHPLQTHTPYTHSRPPAASFLLPSTSPTSRESTTCSQPDRDLGVHLLPRCLTGLLERSSSHAIARGGHSDVWKGYLHEAGRDDGESQVIAMKILRATRAKSLQPGVSTNDRLKKRVWREVDIWYRLQHPNIVPFLGYAEEDDGTPILVSPWFEHGDVSTYLRRYIFADRRKLVRDVAEGLVYLHNQTPPIVHGDLKSGNVLINKKGDAALCDFGLSKLLQEYPSASTPLSTTAVGTLRWCAPELLLAEEPRQTLESDVWAFAALALEILTGRLPFCKSTTDAKVLHNIVNGVIPARANYPELPADNRFWDVLERCWKSNPEERPSIADLRDLIFDDEMFTAV